MSYPFMGVGERHSNVVLSTDAMRRFLSADKYAVIGRTLTDPSRFDHRTLRWYMEHGLPVTPIRPNAMPREIVEGMYVLSDPSFLPDLSSTSISIILHPDLSFPILQAMFPDTPSPTGREPRALWFQPGADDKRVWDWIRARNIEDRVVVRGGCVLRDGEGILESLKNEKDNGQEDSTRPSTSEASRVGSQSRSQSLTQTQLLTPELSGQASFYTSVQGQEPAYPSSVQTSWVPSQGIQNQDQPQQQIPVSQQAPLTNWAPQIVQPRDQTGWQAQQTWLRNQRGQNQPVTPAYAHNQFGKAAQGHTHTQLQTQPSYVPDPRWSWSASAGAGGGPNMIPPPPGK